MSKAGLQQCEKRNIRRKLADRDGLACHYCGLHLHVEGPIDRRFATIEHLKPMGLGGAIRALENMVLACSRCNHRQNVQMQASRL